MFRSPAGVLSLLVTLGASTPAWAIEEPYMWGAGPRIGTIIIPGAYPITFPKITESDFNDADPDDDDAKKAEVETQLERARFDLALGADGVFYIDKSSRLGGLLTFGFGGGGYSDISFLGKYEFIPTEGVVDVIVGGGLGVGSMKFKGEGEEKLRVPYFPIRLNAALQLRDDTRAYELVIYGQSSIPANQFYTDPDGRESEGVGTAFSLFNYLSAGLELVVFFGDFEPPSNRKKKKGKK